MYSNSHCGTNINYSIEDEGKGAVFKNVQRQFTCLFLFIYFNLLVS